MLVDRIVGVVQGDVKKGMNVDNDRAVVVACELSQMKMQGVADLLLLSCDARPVFKDNPNCVSGNSNQPLASNSVTFTRCRDGALLKTQSLLLLLKNLSSSLVSCPKLGDGGSMASSSSSMLSSDINTKWADMPNHIHTLADIVTDLTENSGHSAYLVAVNHEGTTPAIPGLVDRYQASRACLEARLACTRIKKSKTDELNPQVLVQICSTLSKNLAIMTDICRHASEQTKDRADQDQFKHCVKSLTATASCLISSIKTFKNKPTPINQGRCVAFCEPLVASANAFVMFAIEKEFIGVAAVLSSESKEQQTAILGACLSIVSSCIQVCKTIKDLVYDVTNTRHRDRLSMCTESVDKAAAQLSALLMQHDLELNTSTSSSSSSSCSSSRSSTSLNSC